MEPCEKGGGWNHWRDVGWEMDRKGLISNRKSLLFFFFSSDKLFRFTVCKTPPSFHLRLFFFFLASNSNPPPPQSQKAIQPLFLFKQFFPGGGKFNPPFFSAQNSFFSHPPLNENRVHVFSMPRPAPFLFLCGGGGGLQGGFVKG